MFPIPWNKAFRKKDGTLVNIGDAIDAGTEIPEHGEGDAGKVLTVDEDGDLVWSDDAGSEIPEYGVGDSGKLLTVDEDGDLEWSDDVNLEIQALTDKTDVLMENGAVNDLSQPWGTSAGTINGVTFNVNADGSISASGTATEDTSFYLRVSAKPYHANSAKKFTCNPSDGSTDTYYTRVYDKTLGMDIANDVGDGVMLDSGHDFTFIITIKSSYTISETLTFKPMISDPALNLSYDDYVPYAKTNRELTENISDIIGNTSIDRLTLLDPQPTECAFGYAHIYDNGLMYQSSGLITLSADIATNEFIKVGTVAAEHRPTVDRNIQCAKISGTGTVYGTGLVIKSNGDVTFNVRPGMKSGDQYLASGVCIK